MWSSVFKSSHACIKLAWEQQLRKHRCCPIIRLQNPQNLLGIYPFPFLPCNVNRKDGSFFICSFVLGEQLPERTLWEEFTSEAHLPPRNTSQLNLLPTNELPRRRGQCLTHCRMGAFTDTLTIPKKCVRLQTLSCSQYFPLPFFFFKCRL